MAGKEAQDVSGSSVQQDTTASPDAAPTVPTPPSAPIVPQAPQVPVVTQTPVAAAAQQTVASPASPAADAVSTAPSAPTPTPSSAPAPKKSFSLAQQYKDMWAFMRRRVNKLWLIVCIVFVACAILFAWSVSFMSADELNQVYEGLFLVDDGMTSTEWYDFLIHNSVSNLISVAIGFMPFIPLPILDLLLNNMMLGLMVGYVGLIRSVSPWFVALTLVVPHGIVEYPINCLGGTLGLVLWWAVTKKIVGKNPESLWGLIKEILRVFVLVIIPGLLVAGVLEAYLTPAISTFAGW